MTLSITFFDSLHTALSFKFRVEYSNPYPFRDGIGKSTIVVFQVFYIVLII